MHHLRKFPHHAVIAFIVIMALAPLQQAFSQDMIQNHVILKIQKGALLDPILGDLNTVEIDTIAGKNTFLVYYSDSMPVDSVVMRFEGVPEVIYARPDLVCAMPEIDQISQSFPDESRPVFVSGVSPESYYDQAGAVVISADSANLISTGSGVTVAVIDNGIDYNHPLFQNSISEYGYDFIDDDGNPAEETGTLLGHGTFVSGIVKRIAPSCVIMPLRAFDAEGIGSSFKVAQAIYWAVDNGAGVINMSFSMTESDPVIHDAIDAALGASLALSASPGNNGQEMPTYPAAYAGVIAASAIDSLDYIAPFSNYGNYIDVCAPGVNIYSSMAGEYQWGTWSGTSFSAPIVSGVCALVLSLEPGINSYSIRNLIKTTAETDLYWGTLTANDSMYGWGRVNAFNAVWNLAAGDVDMLHGINILDLNYLSRYVFRSGPPPKPEAIRGDMNLNGLVDSIDVNHLVEQIYKNGGGTPAE